MIPGREYFMGSTPGFLVFLYRYAVLFTGGHLKILLQRQRRGSVASLLLEDHPRVIIIKNEVPSTSSACEVFLSGSVAEVPLLVESEGSALWSLALAYRSFGA